MLGLVLTRLLLSFCTHDPDAAHRRPVVAPMDYRGRIDDESRGRFRDDVHGQG